MNRQYLGTTNQKNEMEMKSNKNFQLSMERAHEGNYFVAQIFLPLKVIGPIDQLFPNLVALLLLNCYFPLNYPYRVKRLLAYFFWNSKNSLLGHLNSPFFHFSYDLF
jgi:hypothetical protein